MELLKRQTHPDDSALILLPTWPTGLTPALRTQFRTSLRTHLFGWDSFLAQRLQVSLAKFCQVSAPFRILHSFPRTASSTSLYLYVANPISAAHVLLTD